jgi:hypothetical protein
MTPLTDEARRIEHRPTTIPELRSAARHLTDAGYTPRDVSAALEISEAAVIALLNDSTNT